MMDDPDYCPANSKGHDWALTPITDITYCRHCWAH